MRDLERFIVLRTIDGQWVQHLTAMDNMRTGIGLQAVGQRDPLVAYKQQGHEMFQELLERIRHDVVRLLLHVQVQIRTAVPAVSGRRGISSPMESQQRDSRGEVAGVGAPVRSHQKVGRNDPCPCGSGLKYKRCHGKAA
jgi:preprotein translocase subunit SecA